MRARARTPIEVIVLLTVVVPEVVIAIAALIFFVNVGFELGPTTMLLGHCIFNTSLVMLIVRARFVALGDTLEEASRDLGAGHETWPLHILSALRFGLSPTLNAAATLMIGVTLVGLVLAGLALRLGSRTERKRALA